MSRYVQFLKRIAGFRGRAVERIGRPKSQPLHSGAQFSREAKLPRNDFAQPPGLSRRKVAGIHCRILHTRPQSDGRQQSGFGS
jgi:hypothetical protein